MPRGPEMVLCGLDELRAVIYGSGGRFVRVCVISSARASLARCVTRRGISCGPAAWCAGGPPPPAAGKQSSRRLSGPPEGGTLSPRHQHVLPPPADS